MRWDDIFDGSKRQQTTRYKICIMPLLHTAFSNTKHTYEIIIPDILDILDIEQPHKA